MVPWGPDEYLFAPCSLAISHMAAEDRTNILALFQAATGIENLEAAFSCLEEVHWNLDRALEIYSANTSVRTPSPPKSPSPLLQVSSDPIEPYMPPSGPIESHQPQGFGYNSSSFPLLATVTFDNQAHSFNVYSTKVITDFKREVCVRFNIPSTHLHLSGWPCKINEKMTLGDCCKDPLACILTLHAERKPEENKVVCLQLTYPPSETKEILFPVNNTVMELKQVSYTFPIGFVLFLLV